MPRRLLHKKPLLVISGCSVVAAVSFGGAAWALHERAVNVNQLIYQQCVANEVQDSVIVAQLRAAKVRARASLPKDSPQLLYQLQVLQDGIDALEPPDEQDCPTPKGTGP